MHMENPNNKSTTREAGRNVFCDMAIYGNTILKLIRIYIYKDIYIYIYMGLSFFGVLS